MIREVSWAGAFGSFVGGTLAGFFGMVPLPAVAYGLATMAAFVAVNAICLLAIGRLTGDGGGGGGGARGGDRYEHD